MTPSLQTALARMAFPRATRAARGGPPSITRTHLAHKRQIRDPDGLRGFTCWKGLTRNYAEVSAFALESDYPSGFNLVQQRSTKLILGAALAGCSEGFLCAPEALQGPVRRISKAFESVVIHRFQSSNDGEFLCGTKRFILETKSFP